MNTEFRQVIIDTVRGEHGQYSLQDRVNSIKNKLIEANGNSDKIDYNNFYRGSESYKLVTDLINAIVDVRITRDNPLFQQLVEYKDIPAGDLNEFLVKGNGEGELIISDSASGILGIRRSRISKGERIQIKTSMKFIRVYEALGRLLAGRSTFTEFVDAVSNEFNNKVVGDIYKQFASIGASTAGMSAGFYESGTYDEKTLRQMISGLGRATGNTIKIVAAIDGASEITTAILSNEAKTDLYNMGYYGKFLGTDIILVKDYNDVNGNPVFGKKLVLIATDDKPIKFVREGNPILQEKSAFDNADATQEYMYGELYGTGVILGGRMGIYDLA